MGWTWRGRHGIGFLVVSIGDSSQMDLSGRVLTIPITGLVFLCRAATGGMKPALC